MGGCGNGEARFIEGIVYSINNFLSNINEKVEKGLRNLIDNLDSEERFVKKSKVYYNAEKDRIEVQVSKIRICYFYPTKDENGKKIYRYHLGQ